MCQSTGCSPLSPCVFQTVTNELLIEFINNMASGWKMMRWRGRRQRQREERLVSEGRAKMEIRWQGANKVTDNLVINPLRYYLLNSTTADSRLFDLRAASSSQSGFCEEMKAPVFTVPWRNCFATDFRVWLGEKITSCDEHASSSVFVPLNNDLKSVDAEFKVVLFGRLRKKSDELLMPRGNFGSNAADGVQRDMSEKRMMRDIN